jgi:serine/threonine protein phosphatase PrpC
VAFRTTQNELRSGVNFDTQNSGCTGCVCVLRGQTLVMANVGDSRCVLVSHDQSNGHQSLANSRRRHVSRFGTTMTSCTKNSGTGGTGGTGGTTLCVTPMSDDHKPTRPDEMKRVLECGGAVEPTKYNGQFLGPPRVWMHAQRVGGLAVSRAMGDCAYLAAGVIAVPEFSVHSLLASTDVFLVVGSDGIWDHMSNEEVMRLVYCQVRMKKKTVEQAAKVLVTEARRRWRATGMGYVDDVTAVVVDLELLSALLKE